MRAQFYYLLCKNMYTSQNLISSSLTQLLFMYVIKLQYRKCMNSTGIPSNHLPSLAICHLLCQLPQTNLTCITVNLFTLQNIYFVYPHKSFLYKFMKKVSSFFLFLFFQLPPFHLLHFSFVHHIVWEQLNKYRQNRIIKIE